MPTTAESHHVTHVQDLLHERGATHLRARKYGKSVIVESGPVGDPVKHVRLRRDTVHLWCLDIAGHTGRWERTPFRSALDELVSTVANDFPWTIAPVDENPERT